MTYSISDYSISDLRNIAIEIIGYMNESIPKHTRFSVDLHDKKTMKKFGADGLCHVTTQGTKNHTNKPYITEIRISVYWALSIDKILGTLIHECVHAGLALRGNKTWMVHNKTFKKNCIHIGNLFEIPIDYIY